MPAERLQKILARAGVASRRACEELLTEGRVTVDGRAVSELGAKADSRTQDIRLDGRRLRPEPLQYWILNKPKGVVCTNDDPAGRKRVLDLMGHVRARVFPVGRLDADSKGLLLVTNDGDLANRLAHPRYEVPKTYIAEVSGQATGAVLEQVRGGVHLSEGPTGPADVRVLKRHPQSALLEITIRRGLNRQVRRILARTGLKVRRLTRVAIGEIRLGNLKSGQTRPLSRDEERYLGNLVEDARDVPRRRKRRNPSRFQREGRAGGPRPSTPALSPTGRGGRETGRPGGRGRTREGGEGGKGARR